MGNLETILPKELTQHALTLADDGRGEPELVLPYAQALEAIALATENAIAILGVDSLLVRKDGLQTISYTDYDRRIPYRGNWEAYVTVMNTEAERWTKEHRLGEDHGYTLTSASKEEFEKLPR
jgi:hypothetical protein